MRLSNIHDYRELLYAYGYCYNELIAFLQEKQLEILFGLQKNGYISNAKGTTEEIRLELERFINTMTTSITKAVKDLEDLSSMRVDKKVLDELVVLEVYCGESRVVVTFAA